MKYREHRNVLYLVHDGKTAVHVVPEEGDSTLSTADTKDLRTPDVSSEDAFIGLPIAVSVNGVTWQR